MKGSEITNSLVLDRRPGLFSAFENLHLVFLVFFKDVCVHEQVELAIDNVCIVMITVELLAKGDSISAEATILRGKAHRISLEFASRFRRRKIVGDAIFNNRMRGVAFGDCVIGGQGDCVDAVQAQGNARCRYAVLHIVFVFCESGH